MTDVAISFLSSSLHAEMQSLEELERLARFHAQELELGTIPAFHFLMALMKVESDLGRCNYPRFEYGYSRSSIAYKRSKVLQEGYEKWGDCCAMSYGPTQILWVVAKELGYPGTPMDLWSGVVSIPYTVDLLNRNFKQGASTVEGLAASYNAGTLALKQPERWPNDYVRKFTIAFSEMKRRYLG